jgi:hypothetical protein
VDILIGKDAGPQGLTRTIAGPDADRIKDDIRNIIQLIVTDDSGTIVAFDEVRRENDDDGVAELRIESIPFGATYHFLLLMGHWERDYTAEAEAHNGKYVYTSDPPTLLAAGLLQDKKITGSGKVTVTVWPLVVDTGFTSGIGGTVGPVVNAGKPEAVSLLPVNWNVTWTIKRGLTGNGLTDLVKAQNIASNTGETLLLKNVPKTLLREGSGTGTWSDAALSGNVITGDIGDNTAVFQKIGTGRSVNFKLEYVLFNLTGTGDWTTVDGDKTAFNLSTGGPVWIIRNGVNDKAQTEATDFYSFHHLPKEGETIATLNANGNGAVRFGTAAKTPDGDSTLTVKEGKFIGPWDTTEPDISFTTAGYDGTAEAYYTVVAG